MPTYSIKAPDGRTYTIQGPAGATDAQIRADACHTLGLARHATARSWLTACLQDDEPEVREIAAESLAETPEE